MTAEIDLAMSDVEDLEPSSMQYMAKRKLATSKVIRELTSSQREELEEQAEEWGKKGYPPDMQFK